MSRGRTHTKDDLSSLKKNLDINMRFLANHQEQFRPEDYENLMNYHRKSEGILSDLIFNKENCPDINGKLCRSTGNLNRVNDIDGVSARVSSDTGSLGWRRQFDESSKPLSKHFNSSMYTTSAYGYTKSDC
jgi:hypothetical protein